VGKDFLEHFTSVGGLLPDHRVIDIGCGPGRMAIPLTSFMSSDGSYEGIDTWSEGVDWCSRHITPRFRNFRFGSLDTRAPGGKFPFEDGDFDFAILCAISKLDEKTFRTYVAEAGRVLRSGGVYFGTCFLSYDSYDSHDQGDRQAPLYKSGGQEPPFVFSEHQMEAALSGAGLSIESVHRGAWAGHPEPLSYQDVVVATRS
jgi:SAM-dependent methyltransferase